MKKITRNQADKVKNKLFIDQPAAETSKSVKRKAVNHNENVTKQTWSPLKSLKQKGEKDDGSG